MVKRSDRSVKHHPEKASFYGAKHYFSQLKTLNAVPLAKLAELNFVTQKNPQTGPGEEWCVEVMNTFSISLDCTNWSTNLKKIVRRSTFLCHDMRSYLCY
jgi:hypothetical protein